MRDIDLALLGLINSFAQHWEILDRIALLLVQSSLKAAPLMALLWYVWFSGTDPKKGRSAVFSAFAGGFIALACSLTWQRFAPQLPRPRFDPNVSFAPLSGGLDDVLDDLFADWSSFPSDTAALVFALATGTWLASRRLGLAAFLWATFGASLPRIYTGLHYPSDILAGAILGVLTTGSILLASRAWDLFKPLEWLRVRYAGVFYAGAFLLTYETALFFFDVQLFAAMFRSTAIVNYAD